MVSTSSKFKVQSSKLNGNGPAYLCAGEVRALTGWSEKYLRKLRELGVVRVFKPSRHVRPLYYRAQIEQMLK